MKQYKHKITGNIATETSSGKNYKVSNPQNFTIPRWIVEDSNDWEKIKEKEYEILEFKQINCNNIYFKLIPGTTNYKSYPIDIRVDPDNWPLESLINSSVLKITKVCRNSDKVEFKVGDRIIEGKIQSIIYKDDNIYLQI